MFYYLMAAIIVALDQGTKWLVVRHMDIGDSVELVPRLFYFTSVRNNGAAWNIFEGQMAFFYVVTLIVLVVVIYYMQKIGRTQPLLGTALALIIGGTVGNFVDRLFRGEVVDFIHVYIGTYSFPVFNVADSALSIGVCLLILYVFLDGRKAN
ncbi:MAG: signal peptidase II [Sporolactobacillus sp.]|jgi:signal peptidase II|nr:signal peptidase II [Sporolactobacillus sp.]MCI1881690.1 signal peptidase II [Sporolactobacillus sp.]